AWAGSQRYGAVLWSGDVHSSFSTLRNQLKAGLNMALAGIPWWTTDIGGFFGGDIRDPAFVELLVRWFQYGAFCPVFRLHGDRRPEIPAEGTRGGGSFRSGSANEVWSFGDEAYGVMRKYMLIRERLRPYIRGLMKAAHEAGTPPMRPLFYDFPRDEGVWDVDDQFMFGPDLLVAPVLSALERSRSVYLPAGAAWTEAESGRRSEGGRRIDCEAPLGSMPVFVREGAQRIDRSLFLGL
ncbi:MAG: glycoside hydrolase family 31 protein, partial [Spirochaetaceae bacterium]|nr:glycoside hydrolase family 31 protein [Spirochaetaceae bacterium]